MKIATKKQAADMWSAFKTATVTAFKEAEAESRKCRENEKLSSGKSNAEIPVQKPLPFPTREQQIAQQFRDQSECCALAVYLYKILRSLPDYYNLVRPEDCTSVIVWKNGNGTFSFRCFKKDVTKTMSYASFCNSLKPELQRRQISVSQMARNEIQTAQITYQRRKQALDLRYSLPFFMNYYYAAVMYDLDCNELELERNDVDLNNSFLTNRLVFFGFEDLGEYIHIHLYVQCVAHS
ncbi:MAG: hypothetical protein ACI4EE_04425 [Lachnospiraceae bacterium]